MMALCMLFMIPTVVHAETPTSDTECDLIEYDYVNKTERIISPDEIFDYSATTTSTYELDSMAAYVAQLEQVASPALIVDPDGSFERTSPKDSNGDPVVPYSGVVYLMIGIDWDDDGITDYYDANRGTGFMVGPDVMATAAHCVLGTGESNEYPITSIRVYPLHHGYSEPAEAYPDVYEFVYPERWTYSTAYTDAIANDDLATAFKYDWCIMKLQEPILGVYNFACVYNTSSLVGTTIKLSGYPACPNVDCENCNDNDEETVCTINRGYQITSTGTVTYMDNQVLRYNCNSKGGHSGGPIYNASTYVCYAIHSGSNGVYGSSSAYNRGVVITEFIYNVIADYIAE